MNRLASILMALLLFAALPAFAEDAQQAARPGVEWSSLSPDQQRLLDRYKDNWDELPHERQRNLARGSKRWLSMSPEERSVASKRLEHWRDLSPQQRRMLRDRWLRFQSLSPEEQKAVRENFRRFRDLPPEQRRALRQRWNEATPEERRKLLESIRDQRQRSGSRTSDHP